MATRNLLSTDSRIWRRNRKMKLRTRRPGKWMLCDEEDVPQSSSPSAGTWPPQLCGSPGVLWCPQCHLLSASSRTPKEEQRYRSSREELEDLSPQIEDLSSPQIEDLCSDRRPHQIEDLSSPQIEDLSSDRRPLIRLKISPLSSDRRSLLSPQIEDLSSPMK